MTEQRLTKQQKKVIRREQDRIAFGAPKPMVRLAKRRPRAGLKNQEPMSGGVRLSVYEKQNGTEFGSHHLTPRQRHRFIKKSRSNHPELYAEVAA